MKTIIQNILGAYFNVLALISSGAAGRQAFFTFCFPFKAKLSSKQQEFLGTAQQQMVNVNGIRVQLYRWGIGKQKILLVHGWQSHSYRWRRYIEKLDQSQYSIYSFDAPGHGNSGSKICNVPLYEQTIRTIEEQLGLFDIMIGHSIGSFSLFYYLHTSKRAPKRFVSLAPPRDVRSFFDYYRQALSLSNRTMAALEKYFVSYVGREVDDFALPLFSKSIAIPTLLIHDTQDDSTPYRSSLEAHEILDNSRLITTDGLGHKLRSDGVIDEIISFIADDDNDLSAGV